MKAPYKLLCRTIEGKRMRLDGWKCHTAKSMAGRLFQSPTIRTVRVVDKNKTVYLRLVKDRRGKLIIAKTVNVPSVLALFG